LPDKAPSGEHYIPGDKVEAEIDELQHRMNLRAVVAIFRNIERSVDAPLYELRLRGCPKQTTPSSTPYRSDLKHSKVKLSADIVPHAPPGHYQCQQLLVVTYGGRRVSFDPGTEIVWRNWDFWIDEEPKDQPTFPVPGELIR